MSKPPPRRPKREPDEFQPDQYHRQYDPDDPELMDEDLFSKIRNPEKAKRRKERSKDNWRDTQTVNPDDLKEAIVFELQPKGCFARPTEDLSRRIWLNVRKVLRGKKRLSKKILATGDRVLYLPEGEEEGVVEEVLPRRTKLSRPATRGQSQVEHVLVANADQLAVVASIRMPDVRPGLIDRYWIAAQRNGMETMIILNKIDLDDEDVASRMEEIYLPLGLTVVRTDAVSGLGIDRLNEALKGKMTVFCGHSGVGKSTLLKAILPEQDIRIGEVPKRYAKGRHTTSAPIIYITNEDTLVIDTPGIREFGIWDVKAKDLDQYFPEINAITHECKYNSCRHWKEADCAVKQAVEDGKIHPHRLQSYQRIRDSIAAEYS